MIVNILLGWIFCHCRNLGIWLYDGGLLLNSKEIDFTKSEI